VVLKSALWKERRDFQSSHVFVCVQLHHPFITSESVQRFSLIKFIMKIILTCEPSKLDVRYSFYRITAYCFINTYFHSNNLLFYFMMQLLLCIHPQGSRPSCSSQCLWCIEVCPSVDSAVFFTSIVDAIFDIVVRWSECHQLLQHLGCFVTRQSHWHISNCRDVSAVKYRKDRLLLIIWDL
jgi:hypothetical protein